MYCYRSNVLLSVFVNDYCIRYIYLLNTLIYESRQLFKINLQILIILRKLEVLHINIDHCSMFNVFIVCLFLFYLNDFLLKQTLFFILMHNETAKRN